MRDVKFKPSITLIGNCHKNDRNNRGLEIEFRLTKYYQKLIAIPCIIIFY